MSTVTPTPSTRVVGRPRDPALDARILDAVVALMGQWGFTAVTMDAVAAEAGVSKPTIYRRWASKEDLVLDAMAAHQPAFAVPDLPDPREALIAFVAHLFRWGSTTEWSLLPRLMDAVLANPDLAASFRERVVAPRSAALRVYLEGARARGELRHDVDVDAAAELLVGPPMVARIMAIISGAELGDPADAAERVVDTVWLGISPGAAAI